MGKGDAVREKLFFGPEGANAVADAPSGLAFLLESHPRGPFAIFSVLDVAACNEAALFEDFDVLHRMSIFFLSAGLFSRQGLRNMSGAGGVVTVGKGLAAISRGSAASGGTDRRIAFRHLLVAKSLYIQTVFPRRFFP
jgi:hypothetical protein